MDVSMNGRAILLEDSSVSLQGLPRWPWWSFKELREAGGISALRAMLTTESLDVISIMHQLKNTGRPCKYKSWFHLNIETGEKGRFCCNSWECADCRPVVAQRAARKANSGEAGWMMTITNVPDNKGECRLKWQHFLRALKNGYGPTYRPRELSELDYRS